MMGGSERRAVAQREVLFVVSETFKSLSILIPKIDGF